IDGNVNFTPDVLKDLKLHVSAGTNQPLDVSLTLTAARNINLGDSGQLTIQEGATPHLVGGTFTAEIGTAIRPGPAANPFGTGNFNFHVNGATLTADGSVTPGDLGLFQGSGALGLHYAGGKVVANGEVALRLKPDYAEYFDASVTVNVVNNDPTLTGR